MLEVSWVIVLSTIFFLKFSTANYECALLSSNHFQWLNEDGSLALPLFTDGVTVQNETNDSCCGLNCDELWQPLADSPNCQFCASNTSLVCHGSTVYTVPNPATLPTTNLSLFKMSGVGLIALPPKSFTGLSIYRLVIEDSNLTYIASDTFTGLKSINSLHLRNNTLYVISQAGHLFEDIQDLSVLKLDSTGLRVLSSLKSANLQKLEYFSLAGNPIHELDLLFLQNSGLRFLDLRSVTFRINPKNMEDSGFTSLPNTLDTLDLSRANISVGAIKKMMDLLSEKNITTLNLGFLVSSTHLLVSLLPIRKSLKYLSLEGTDMNDVFPLKQKDKISLTSKTFFNLIELNMKNCSINELGAGDVFQAFPNLNTLSLSGNNFMFLDLTLFLNLPTLNYMDLSMNYINDIHPNINSVAKNLTILDLSFVTFDVDEEKSRSMFNAIPYLLMLSLCSAEIENKQVEALQSLINLKFIDLSNTLPNSPELVSTYSDLFVTLNSSLRELHFNRNNFQFSSNYPSFFSSLSSLQILDISNNFIREFSQNMFGSSLEHLKVSQNLITTWYSSTISNGSQLKYLDLSNNQITFVSDAMISDFYKLNSLNVNSNPLICHNKVVAMVCASVKNETHNLTMISWQQYSCYDVFSNSYRHFSKPEECDEYFEEAYTTHDSQGGNNNDQQTTNHPNSPKNLYNSNSTWKSVWMYIIVGPSMLAAVAITYVKWWNIRCYVHRYFSLRKARLLRKFGESLTKPELQYDVFVSYSDVDRSWVLDHLIPNMEADGDICLCFHERDFQVGLNILENIMECMDRSHSLLLIVSKAFVRSKWCQFEMHLAQYRLIETLRDQLVLVLLEDIPRKSRPQTLQHLMMTKTYLVWPSQPCQEDATQLFWKRLKRALKPNNNYIFDI